MYSLLKLKLIIYTKLKCFVIIYSQQQPCQFHLLIPLLILFLVRICCCCFVLIWFVTVIHLLLHKRTYATQTTLNIRFKVVYMYKYCMLILWGNKWMIKKKIIILIINKLQSGNKIDVLFYHY